MNRADACVQFEKTHRTPCLCATCSKVRNNAFAIIDALTASRDALLGACSRAYCLAEENQPPMTIMKLLRKAIEEVKP